ncbi:hypothetical protein HAL1_14150 [Halomonas sp. HAL1]|nr:hypothetical protein HAL1_14150 [Halomonas sp. HAL1]
MALASVTSAALTQRRNVEVGLGRGSRADADRFVGQTHVHQFTVGLGMYCDCTNAQFLAGSQDAQCDLAAVSDKYLIQHGVIHLFKK